MDQGYLSCKAGHRYPVVGGIPVLLIDEVQQTIGLASRSIEEAWRCVKEPKECDEWHVSTLGISEQEKAGVMRTVDEGQWKVDPVVQFLVGATSGYMYKHLIGALGSYPIPELRLPEGYGKVFLDLGCSWGRWCVAACRKGYRAIGIDPSLGALAAAKRMSKELGVTAYFAVGDARYMPIADGIVDQVFSYSVLQHLSNEDVGLVLAEVSRVLRPGGRSMIQMANAFGVRSIYHQIRRGLRAARRFEVRYRTVGSLQKAFEAAIGPSKVFSDCFFGLGLQKRDVALMGPSKRLMLNASEALREASRWIKPLRYVADSVYVESMRASARDAEV
jgi:SAM-dependent methyltransferase